MAHEVVLTATLLETLEQCETDDAERVIAKLEDIEDFPGHFLDRLKDHPGYKLRVGDFRVLIDWDKDDEMLHAIDAFERKRSIVNSGSTVRCGGPGGTTRRGDCHRIRTVRVVRQAAGQVGADRDASPWRTAPEQRPYQPPPPSDG